MTTPRDTTRNYFQPAKSSKPKRKGIRKMSAKKARELKEYTRLRAAFMAERPVCEVWLKENGWERQSDGSYLHAVEPIIRHEIEFIVYGAPLSSECHHVHGRGKNYLNVSTWMAVSAEAHRRIHSQPSWARANGFLK